MKAKQELLLIRGIPGSGKSTIAKTYEAYKHFEADMYFIDNEMYRFNHKLLTASHEWCQEQTRKALVAGHSVVVSNTFIKLWEMRRYEVMAKQLSIPLRVIVARGKYKSIHDIKPEKINQMRRNFEPLVRIKGAKGSRLHCHE